MKELSLREAAELIASRIGSPGGEGATYSYDNDHSHLDEVDKLLLVEDIINLVNERRLHDS